MRRFLAVLLVAALALGLAACGDDDDAGSGDASTPSTTPAAADLGLKTPGVLTVASDVPYAPFELTDPGSTEIKGFDVDLVKAIAATQGITDVQFVDQSFETIILSIRQGRFDMSASSWTITPERAKEVDFGDPYFSANQAFLVQEDSTVTRSTTWPGRTSACSAARSGSTSPKTIPGAKVLTYDTTDDAFNALAQGRLDAAVTDFPVVGLRRAPRSRSSRSPSSSPATWPSASCSRRTTPPCATPSTRGSRRSQADGTYDTIYKQWFGDAPISSLPSGTGTTTTSTGRRHTGGVAPWTRSSVSTSTGIRRDPISATWRAASGSPSRSPSSPS